VRKLSIILIVFILFNIFFVDVRCFAENSSIKRLESMSNVEISHLTDEEIKTAIISSDDYFDSVSAYLRYGETTSGDYDERINVALNISSYRKYRKIIYGQPFERQNNYPGVVLHGSEPKYIGFNVFGNAVTNDKYPGDSEGDEPPEKDWIMDLGQYSDSWEIFSRSSLEDDEKISMYDHMLNSDTINDDAVGTYTLAEILNKKMGNLNRYLKSNISKLREELESVVELQMLPTFESDGSFVMGRYKGRRKKYDTMGWPRFGEPEEYLTIEPEKEYIVMFPNQNEVENKFKVTLHMKDKLSGMDTYKLMKENVKLGLGEDKVAKVEAINPTYTFTKKYNRSDYDLGKNTVVEMGKYSFNSIFDEPYIGEETCDFQLDIKMDGNIIADFIINHNDTDYTEKLITLGEGKWDDGDDKVKLVLKDNSEIIDSNSDDNNIERKIISWNWYINDTKGNYILLNSKIKKSTFNDQYSFL
jgi:hypothetical protein